MKIHSFLLVLIIFLIQSVMVSADYNCEVTTNGPNGELSHKTNFMKVCNDFGNCYECMDNEAGKKILSTIRDWNDYSSVDGTWYFATCVDDNTLEIPRCDGTVETINCVNGCQKNGFPDSCISQNIKVPDKYYEPNSRCPPITNLGLGSPCTSEYYYSCDEGLVCTAKPKNPLDRPGENIQLGNCVYNTQEVPEFRFIGGLFALFGLIGIFMFNRKKN